MITILNFFLIIFIFLVIMVISVVLRIASSFHSLRKQFHDKENASGSYNGGSTRTSTDRTDYSQNTSRSGAGSSNSRSGDVDPVTGKKKIIPKDEGEYVDYEEL